MEETETKKRERNPRHDRSQWGPCVLCKIRKQRRVNGLCDVCDKLTDAEGTKKRFGIPVHKPVLEQNLKRIREYNKLIRQGIRQGQIAQQWGWGTEKLRSLVARMKNKHGVKVESGHLPRRVKETRQTDRRPRTVIEHGGGSKGRADCRPRCELCNATYLAYYRTRGDIHRANRSAQQGKPS